MYEIWIYATTKLIAELPIMVFVALLTMVMLYWSIGFTDSVAQFTEFFVIIFMIINASTAMGYALSSAFSSAATATAFAPIINLPLSVLGGYMLSLNGIFQKTPQKYIAWLTYFSPIRYGYFGMMSA